jgi:hypothetical protein
VGVEFVVVGGSLRWPIMQFGNSGVDQEYCTSTRYWDERDIRSNEHGILILPLELGVIRLEGGIKALDSHMKSVSQLI